ncbi:hypothetical protein AB0M28_22840 [Streptomyces sp. NPDC051940]|uniref:hypothetical protein n=1 Tax=Streptomyces sp. NPDC051940 TaxID=3155675 RepID=UPI003423ED4A
MELLSDLVAGEGQSFLAAGQGRDLPEECRDAARSGIWLICRQICTTSDPDTLNDAYELLTLIEKDKGRLERLRESLSDRLSWELRT